MRTNCCHQFLVSLKAAKANDILAYIITNLFKYIKIRRTYVIFKIKSFVIKKMCILAHHNNTLKEYYCFFTNIETVLQCHENSNP